jgi:hypothetical protein
VEARAHREADLHRGPLDPAPDRLDLGVVGLQLHERLLRVGERGLRGGDLLLEFRGGLRAQIEPAYGGETLPVRRAVQLGILVETVEGREVEVLEIEGPRVGFPFDPAGHHRDGQAPVAHMVLADDGVPQAFEDARDGVADDIGAQVPDMHLLGEVDPAEVDDDGLGVLGRREAQLGGVERDEQTRERVGPERDVDEPRAGDRGLGQRLGEVAQVRLLDDRGGDLARVLAQALPERHRGVGLEVAELRVAGRADERVRVLDAERALDRVGDRRGDERRGVDGWGRAWLLIGLCAGHRRKRTAVVGAGAGLRPPARRWLDPSRRGRARPAARGDACAGSRAGRRWVSARSADRGRCPRATRRWRCSPSR